MGLINPEALYTDGCRHIIDGNPGYEVCGRSPDSVVHDFNSISYDHDYID